jgi:hypothetical protein
MPILECTVSPIVKETQFFIPLSQSRIAFLLTKNRPNSKPLICSPREAPSSFEFTEVRKCADSLRVQAHVLFDSARSNNDMGNALRLK